MDLTICSSVRISLQPLRAFLHLESLHLEGNSGDYNAKYTHLDDSATHLTCLSLTCCLIECSQTCVCSASLLTLRLEGAQLLRFHDQGVAACSDLRTLSCVDAVVGATDAAYTLNLQEEACIIPADLSLLISLTTLEFQAGDWVCGGEIELSWLTGFTALHQARLSWVPYKVMVLPECICTMCSLKDLSIIADYDGRIECWFDWKALKLHWSMWHYLAMSDYLYTVQTVSSTFVRSWNCAISEWSGLTSKSVGLIGIQQTN